MLETDPENAKCSIKSFDDLEKCINLNTDNTIVRIQDKIIDFDLTINKRLSNKKTVFGFYSCTFNFPIEIQSIENEELNFVFEFQDCRFNKILNIRRTKYVDLNLTQCVFKNEVKIQKCQLDYLRLSGSVFDDELLLMDSCIKEIIIWDSNEKAKFNGDVRFCYLNVLYVNLKGAFFAKDLYLQDVIFEGHAIFTEIEVRGKLTFCSSLFMENIKSDGKYKLAQFEINGKGFFEKMKIHEMDIQYVSFDNSLYFNASNIELLKIHNIHINRDFHFRGLTVNCSNQETACFLKDQALRQNDKILVIEMRAQEMEQYKKRLLSENTRCKLLLKTDWWMLMLNTWSNDNGTNWIKGILFTLGAWILFFSWYIISRDGWGDTFIFCDDLYLKEAIKYLWLFNGIEDIRDDYWRKITFLTLLPYFLGKILIAYGIYQTISAFRKYNH